MCPNDSVGKRKVGTNSEKQLPFSASVVTLSKTECHDLKVCWGGRVMSFPELQVPKNGRKIWNIDLIMILVLKFDFFRGGLPEPVVHAVSRPWTAGKIPKLPPKFVLPSKGGREMHSSNSSKKVCNSSRVQDCT